MPPATLNISPLLSRPAGLIQTVNSSQLLCHMHVCPCLGYKIIRSYTTYAGVSLHRDILSPPGRHMSIR